MCVCVCVCVYEIESVCECMNMCACRCMGECSEDNTIVFFLVMRCKIVYNGGRKKCIQNFLYIM